MSLRQPRSDKPAIDRSTSASVADASMMVSHVTKRLLFLDFDMIHSINSMPTILVGVCDSIPQFKSVCCGAEKPDEKVGD